MTDFVVRFLEIQNFKGIEQLTLELSDTVTHIYGDNATGKTTVYDALTWLLFGKDCTGSARFSIKPVGRKGTTPTVTAVCEVNGQAHTLRKVLRERWSKPRGGLRARYEGDTIEYTVDDLPKKEASYKKWIADFVSEEAVFRLLTGVHQFARDLPWRERRQILTEVCGLPQDAEILEAEPQFAPLSEALGTRTVAEYHTALLIARKDTNKTLDTLPIRMDECERRIAALADMDFEAAKAQQRTLTEREDAVRAELAGLAGNSLVRQTQAEHQALLAEETALEAENRAYRSSQQAADNRSALQAQLMQLENDLHHLRAQMSRAQTAVMQGKMQLDNLKSEQPVRIQEVCPTCGQPLPPEYLSDIQAQAEQERQTREQDCLFVQRSVEQAEQTVKEQEEMLRQKTEARDACAAQLAVCPAAEPPTDLPAYQTRKDALRVQIAQAADKLSALQNGQADMRRHLMERLAALKQRRAEAEQVLAAQVSLQQTRERLAELAGEKQRYDEKRSELDRHIALCEAFVRYKAQFLTRTVNSRFTLAQFSLFREQLNGSLAECCEVMVNGVPYDDLNHAMQVNVGVDIIRTLSAHYGLHVPLVVDNAESVTQLQGIPTQVIRLVVSASDSALRVEAC